MSSRVAPFVSALVDCRAHDSGVETRAPELKANPRLIAGNSSFKTIELRSWRARLTRRNSGSSPRRPFFLTVRAAPWLVFRGPLQRIGPGVHASSMANQILGLVCLAASLTCLDCNPQDMPNPGPGSGEPGQKCEKQDGKEVRLLTEDGVELKAVHYSSGVPGAKAVVLLHMIPPRFDLNNYSAPFIEELRARGLDVINVNRRGAKGSDGNAEDAYDGPSGWLDALAGVHFLLDSPCKNDPEGIAMIGASNGSTTMIDYNIRAHHSPNKRQPQARAMVFLSGGPYTENQHKISKELASLSSIPAFFAYPKAEAEWNLEIQSLSEREKVACWSFQEYGEEAHGTFMFDSNPEIIPEIGSFLERKLGL